jgi:hypothetical protein
MKVLLSLVVAFTSGLSHGQLSGKYYPYGREWFDSFTSEVSTGDASRIKLAFKALVARPEKDFLNSNLPNSNVESLKIAAVRQLFSIYFLSPSEEGITTAMRSAIAEAAVEFAPRELGSTFNGVPYWKWVIGHHETILLKSGLEAASSDPTPLQLPAGMNAKLVERLNNNARRSWQLGREIALQDIKWHSEVWAVLDQAFSKLPGYALSAAPGNQGQRDNKLKNKDTH